jgi:three-Cys-motif partner protein
VDVIVTVMTSYMKRFGAHPALAAPLDRFFGDWRTVVGDLTDEKMTSRKLLDHYESQLQKLDFVAFNDDVRVENSRESTIYHLVFASKHKRGADFFSKISRRDSSGQGRLF